MSKRIGGIIYLKVDGVLLQAKGDFSYSLLERKKESVIGAGGIHGYKETPVVPFIEGEITDALELDVKSILNLKDATITLELANEKVVVLKSAFFAGDGTTSTGEGNIQVRFEGNVIEEVR